MKSKGWKWLLIAPLTASLLTACADSDGNNKNATSPYAGIWMRQGAFNDYYQGRPEYRANQTVAPAMFCQAVDQNYYEHGMAQPRGRLAVQAYYVNPYGDVYHWTPSANYAQASSRLMIGRVGGSPGRFAALQPNPDLRFGWDDHVARNSWVQNSSMERYDKRLTWYRVRDVNGSLADLDFVAVSEVEIREYVRMLRLCRSGVQIEDYGYYGHGGVAMVPPPAPLPMPGPGPGYDQGCYDQSCAPQGPGHFSYNKGKNLSPGQGEVPPQK